MTVCFMITLCVVADAATSMPNTDARTVKIIPLTTYGKTGELLIRRIIRRVPFDGMHVKMDLK